jgi:soluble lytic murein transglycosylase-like protein
MRRTRARVRSSTLALILFLALTVQATPSHPAVHGRPTTPSAATADAAGAGARGELAARLARLAPRSDLAVVSSGDLEAALGAHPRRFGLFRADSAVDGRGELLSALPYGAILAAAGERNHVDALLLAAVVEAESRFAPRAVSREGARGLMQLLPSTGKDYGAKDLLDPYANVEAGSRYLGRLLKRFNNRPDLALAAYNTGPEVIARYGCVPPYRETREFVKRVLERYAQHRSSLDHRAPPPKGYSLAAIRPGRSSRAPESAAAAISSSAWSRSAR